MDTPDGRENPGEERLRRLFDELAGTLRKLPTDRQQQLIDEMKRKASDGVEEEEQDEGTGDDHRSA